LIHSHISGVAVIFAIVVIAFTVIGSKLLEVLNKEFLHAISIHHTIDSLVRVDHMLLPWALDGLSYMSAMSINALIIAVWERLIHGTFMRTTNVLVLSIIYAIMISAVSAIVSVKLQIQDPDVD
jgi:hypothetical protein